MFGWLPCAGGSRTHKFFDLVLRNFFSRWYRHSLTFAKYRIFARFFMGDKIKWDYFFVILRLLRKGLKQWACYFWMWFLKDFCDDSASQVTVSWCSWITRVAKQSIKRYVLRCAQNPVFFITSANSHPPCVGNDSTYIIY